MKLRFAAYGHPQPGYQGPQGPSQPDYKSTYPMEQPSYSQGHHNFAS